MGNYIVLTGRYKVHKKTCGSIRQSLKRNPDECHEYTSLNEPVQKGHKLCKICLKGEDKL